MISNKYDDGGGNKIICRDANDITVERLMISSVEMLIKVQGWLAIESRYGN